MATRPVVVISEGKASDDPTDRWATGGLGHGSRARPASPIFTTDRARADGNGFAHVRAALVGPSLAFLVRGGRPLRGTWQQVILRDFENRPRGRTVEVKVTGKATP